MIIENQYWKFYVPDDVMNDKILTVDDINKQAIPYSEYIKQIDLDKNTKRIAEIDAEILDLEKEPDEILVPNDNKILQLQQLEEEKNNLLTLI